MGVRKQAGNRQMRKACVMMRGEGREMGSRGAYRWGVQDDSGAQGRLDGESISGAGQRGRADRQWAGPRTSVGVGLGAVAVLEAVLPEPGVAQAGHAPTRRCAPSAPPQPLAAVRPAALRSTPSLRACPAASGPGSCVRRPREDAQ